MLLGQELAVSIGSAGASHPFHALVLVTSATFGLPESLSERVAQLLGL